MSEPYLRGDVFWAPDPYRTGSNPRLWLVLAAVRLLYAGEEYICTALTTSDLPANHEVGDAWEAGREPDTTSYVSPWVLGTIKHQAVVNPQGRLSTPFTKRMAAECIAYLES